MSIPAKPTVKPAAPSFSSGPTTKPPGWTTSTLDDAFLGRSHRAKEGKSRLQQAIEETKALLQLPPDYRVGIVPASDTGAVEMALWSLLGPRPVDVLAWDVFGKDWVTDVTKQLKLDARVLDADFGKLPDLSQVDFNKDVVFTYNGTTSGVCVPNLDWIPADREGLTICDATSAVLGMPIDWSKCDVVTFSWQKALGGEGAHGILVLSPRAVERLESHTPTWPMPKIFRMTKGGKLVEGIFTGETINTPSMLCVEDALVAMNWARSVGGQEGCIARTQANFKELAEWVTRTPWIDFLAENEAARSPTSVTLKITDPEIAALSAEDQAAFCKKLVGLVEKEGAGYDIAGHRDAPTGLRVWCGATVQREDISKLTPWLDWAHATAKLS